MSRPFKFCMISIYYPPPGFGGDYIGHAQSCRPARSQRLGLMRLENDPRLHG